MQEISLIFKSLQFSHCEKEKGPIHEEWHAFHSWKPDVFGDYI